MRSFRIMAAVLVVSLGFVLISTPQSRAQDRCEVTIEKVAIPANNTEFEFSGPPTFTLSDPGNPTHIVDVLAQDDGNRTTIIEEDRLGWELESIVCTPPTGGFCVGPGGPTPCLTITVIENGINIDCFDSGRATCTFTNALIQRDVPTLSQYGLIAMAGVLGLVAFFVMRRKKAAA